MRAFLILAILAAILAVALGDVCIGIPGSLAIGSSCGNSAGYCRKGSFCSSKSVCTALIKVGGNCSNPLDQCVPEAECHGPAGSKVCLALVGIGEDCSNNVTLPVAPCAGELFCSNGKCTGAYPGDACTANTDCVFGTCTSGICPFVTDGQSCLTSFQCQPQSYCNQIGGASACAPLPIAGNCTSSIGCGYGYACVAPSATDAKQCVAVGSLTEGTYCDGSHVACKSGVCSRNYCATNPPVLCNSASPSPCGADRYCVCGGLEFLAGFGSCSSVSCTYESKDFEKCWRTNCKSSTTGKGSCATLNCATQYTKLDSCSSASGLFASFTFVSLAVLFISFFSRQL